MPNSFQMLAVIAIALLPGALYVWAFEREVGRWGIGLADRVLRFFGGSAIFHAVMAPATYWLWARDWKHVAAGEPLSWLLWLAPLAYVLIPSGAGVLVGSAVRRGDRKLSWIAGRSPAPRSWDHLFGGQPDGWVRMRLKSGGWIGGVWAQVGDRRSYAAGYPEDQDLFLAATASVDPDSGEFLTDDGGNVEVLPGALLVRWSEVEFLEFIDA